MVYVTGDTHADFGRFSMHHFPEQKKMTKDDFVIICGDFGGVWDDCESERYWLDWLNDKPFTTLFIDGNHENFDRLYGGEFEEVDFHGGRAHKVRDSVYHLMRGFVFDLHGRKYFAFGGASSHDISDGIIDESDYEDYDSFKRAIKTARRLGMQFRVNHKSWWQEEMPDDTEMQRGLSELKKCGNKVDYIISHSLPQPIVDSLTNGLYEPDPLTLYFKDLVDSGVEFTCWYSGHYHLDQHYSRRYCLLYTDIEAIYD